SWHWAEVSHENARTSRTGIEALVPSAYSKGRRLTQTPLQKHDQAAARRFCLTSAVDVRRPLRLEPRFTLTDCLRFRLSCKTLTRSTTLVAGAFTSALCA